MNRIGVNLYTKLIAEYAEVSLDEALAIQKYIDEMISLDWSEATAGDIEVTIELAQRLMKEGV